SAVVEITGRGISVVEHERSAVAVVLPEPALRREARAEIEPSLPADEVLREIREIERREVPVARLHAFVVGVAERRPRIAAVEVRPDREAEIRALAVAVARRVRLARDLDAFEVRAGDDVDDARDRVGA